MKRGHFFVMLGLLGGLGACTVAGPDYQRPAGAVANAPAASAPFTGSSANIVQEEPPAHWWRLYADPRLDTLVTQALTANADLRAANANLRQAQAVVSEALAGRTVAASTAGGLSLSRPQTVGGALPGTVGYDIGIGASLPLDLSGKIRRGIEAARGDAESVRAARDAVRVTVAAATARAYAAICAANHQLAAADRVLRIERQSLDVTTRLAEGGRGTAFDVTRARAAVEQTEATLPGFTAERMAALYQLAALLGRPAGNYPKDIASCAAIPHPARAIPVGDGAALLRRRPDIRAAERALAADTARIGVATADLYPQVSLGGSAGLTGPLASIGSDKALRLKLGPLISWTFPNRRVTRARIAEADAAAQASFAHFDSVVLDALRQTETALSAYAREIDRNRALARARDSAAAAADQAGRLYRFGRADFLSLLTAQNSLASAETVLAASDAALANREIDLFLALGGGWQD
ncbi:MAG TPA: efflux transporter outer membrane subunit [Sphingomonadaceae bacterium]|nr:efflux transporter outer membrane subunit [Sphingomonadaceae bacterium]